MAQDKNTVYEEKQALPSMCTFFSLRYQPNSNSYIKGGSKEVKCLSDMVAPMNCDRIIITITKFIHQIRNKVYHK